MRAHARFGRGELLASIRHEPGLTPTALAARLGVGRAGVAMPVAELVREGLVRRQRDPRDRRCCRLMSSEEGERVARRLLDR